MTEDFHAEQIPFGTDSFADNPEPRCPCLSVAERSFSLLHRVQMFVKPMAQLFLCNCR